MDYCDFSLHDVINLHRKENTHMDEVLHRSIFRFMFYFYHHGSIFNFVVLFLAHLFLFLLSKIYFDHINTSCFVFILRQSRSRKLHINTLILCSIFNSQSSIFNIIRLLDSDSFFIEISQTLVMYYAIDLINMVKTLHDNQIIHGDIKPDNVLLLELGRESGTPAWAPDSEGWVQKGLKLIDFGHSIDVSLQPAGSIYRTENNFTDNFKCVEMMTGKPWTKQVNFPGNFTLKSRILYEKSNFLHFSQIFSVFS